MYIPSQDEINFMNCEFYSTSSSNRSPLLNSSLFDNEQIYFENSRFSECYNRIGFVLNTNLQYYIL